MIEQPLVGCDFVAMTKNLQKNYYVDGHEREDVVAHRVRFLEQMKEYEKRFFTYQCTSDDEVPIRPQCDKPLIYIVHDETTLYANNASKIIWIDSEESESTIRPKSNGKSLMISGFMCACHGFICKNIDGNIKRSYKTIKPGKQRDGYWTNENLVEQLEEVIPLFKSVHPECELLFAFDNSQNHHAKAADALVASRLNKSDGGVGVKVMSEGKKVAKGVQKILTERINLKEGKFFLAPFALPELRPLLYIVVVCISCQNSLILRINWRCVKKSSRRMKTHAKLFFSQNIIVN